MADIEAFDPAAYEAFKAQASGVKPGAIEAFDPDAYAAFKAQARRGPGPQTASDLALGGEDPSQNTPATETPTGRILGTPTGLYAAASSAMDSIPVVGPMLTGASDRLAAGIRSYRDGTSYGDELKRIQDYDAGAQAAHPVASTVGSVAGQIGGIAPLAIAAPELLGAGTAAFPTRMLASTVSSGLLGGADAAVRSGGDLRETEKGAATGATLGLGAPVLGAAVGAGVRKVGEMAAERFAPTAGFGSAAAGKLADDVASSGGADAVRARLADLGQPAMLMDASPSFTGRAQGLAVEPATRGAIVTSLETRATGANARIRGDVDQALGPAADPATVRAARQQSYDQVVPPMYRQAVGQPVQVDTSNVLGMIGDLRSQEKGPAADALARAWILSWRADRLANMKDFTAGASDPVSAQANFLLQENPQLTQALQNAQSPQEANRLMAQAWKFQGYDQPGGENVARLATTQAYANSLGSGQALPATSAPRGASMGSTAQRGGFGLGGVVGQGSAVPGQSSPTPDAASLAGQPTALDGSQDQGQQQGGSYGGIASALKSIAGGQQKQGQKAAGGGGMAPPKMDGRAMTLQQARQQFDASRFYSMLPRGGRAG